MSNHPASTEPPIETTLSLASSWSEILPVMLALMTDGKPAGRLVAQHELKRMAHVADLGNEALNALQELVGDDPVEGPAHAVLGQARRLASPRVEDEPAGVVVPGASKSGKLAKRLSGADLELQVCYSACGFYLGTFDERGAFSRESKEYWRTNELARAALFSGVWTQREQP